MTTPKEICPPTVTSNALNCLVHPHLVCPWLNFYSMVSLATTCTSLMRMLRGREVDLARLGRTSMDRLARYQRYWRVTGACVRLSGTEPFLDIPRMQTLVLSRSTWITALPRLAPVDSPHRFLRQLYMDGCHRMTDIGCVTACPSLQVVDLRSCRVLTQIAPIAECTELRELILSGCRLLSDLTPLARCTNLEVLQASCCGFRAMDLDPLFGCSRLRMIDLSYNSNLNRVPDALAGCPRLSSIDLNQCIGLTNIAVLGSCSALAVLSLGQCRGLLDLTALGYCTRLHTLSLTGISIATLNVLSPCTGLVNLNLDGCVQLMDISAVMAWPLLQKLSCSGCTGIPGLDPLATCTQLRHLDLWGCTVSVLCPLQHCRRLQTLSLGRCRNIRYLDALSGCSDLQVLDLQECVHIVALGPLDHCMQLTELDVRVCPCATKWVPLLQTLEKRGCGIRY
jgi:Leucine-rich repeat (LRR) protein